MFTGSLSYRVVAALLATAFIAGTAAAGGAVTRPVGTFTAAPAGGLATALYDTEALGGSSLLEFQRARDAGAGFVRIYADLAKVVAGGSSAPSAFDWSNPDDPHYSWAPIDRAVETASAAGLEPILDLDGAPGWAEDSAQPGRYMPSARWFGRFAQAAAKRYSGTFDGLPPVRYWEAWNEPNLELYLSPARTSGVLFAADWYRTMVNAFAAGVKRVDATNFVIAGALAPYAALDGPGIAPLTFMRAFLCLDRIRIRPRPRCLARPAFDIWSMHPYTWGGPTHHSPVAGDVQLGDMPAMRDLLDQAWAAGRIVAAQKPNFWVTEFSWNSNPPNEGGVPMTLLTRWTAQALYTMWQSGVSLATWYQLRDMTSTPTAGPGNSGLYFNSGGDYGGDPPKVALLEAFRFPVVAFPDPGGIRVWARSPTSTGGDVRFEQDSGAGWQTLAVLTADSNGIVGGVIPGSAVGSVRAVFLPTGESSTPFGLADVPDQDVNPFG